MRHAVLTTKLTPPPVAAERVPRPRLLTRLDRGTQERLTLVSAPAGYGKTTALVAWAARARAPVAWLSVDRDDNDAGRFLRHLVAALQRRDETLQQLGDFVGDDLEAALITVVNDVSANPTPLVLVLDDYHWIDGEGVHDQVRFLLDHAPRQLRLVVAGRADPPLPLARLRVGGTLTEIRAEELRFTPEEAGALLARQGLVLPASDVRELTLRTEGWPAGLQLAALSLRGRSDPHAFISFFTGTDRYVLDYLTEEVLLRQPPEVQDFLLMTSVLDAFDAELAAAVTGTADAAAMLRRIERENLFLVSLDSERRRYRYHAFFQDLLQHRLRGARPDLPARLRARAAAALAARGATDAALAYERAAAGSLPDAARPPGAAPVRAGGRAPAADGAQAESPEPLTERESEVLHLIAAGLANKQIARRLHLSLNTVKTHTRNIYAKLGVDSRTWAAARARELGMA